MALAAKAFCTNFSGKIRLSESESFSCVIVISQGFVQIRESGSTREFSIFSVIEINIGERVEIKTRDDRFELEIEERVSFIECLTAQILMYFNASDRENLVFEGMKAFFVKTDISHLYYGFLSRAYSMGLEVSDYFKQRFLLMLISGVFDFSLFADNPQMLECALRSAARALDMKCIDFPSDDISLKVLEDIYNDEFRMKAIRFKGETTKCVKRFLEKRSIIDGMYFESVAKDYDLDSDLKFYAMNNNLMSLGLPYLPRDGFMRNLTFLTIEKCENIELSVIIEQMEFLESLTLKACGIDIIKSVDMLSSKKLHNLQHIDLSSNKLIPYSTQITFPRPISLVIRDVEWTTDTLSHILRIFEQQTGSLDLSECKFSSVDQIDAKSLQLKSLIWNDNTVNSCLASILSNSHVLETLSINGSLSERYPIEITQIISFISTSATLNTLSVQGSKDRKLGKLTILLLSSLLTNKNIHNLDISFNDGGDEAYRFILTHLKDGLAVQKVAIDGQNVTDKLLLKELLMLSKVSNTPISFPIEDFLRLFPFESLLEYSHYFDLSSSNSSWNFDTKPRRLLSSPSTPLAEIKKSSKAKTDRMAQTEPRRKPNLNTQLIDFSLNWTFPIEFDPVFLDDVWDRMKSDYDQTRIFDQLKSTQPSDSYNKIKKSVSKHTSPYV